MYDIKTLIEKMKTASGIKSNIELAALLNVSYNTLNTWIKRHKLPQEVLVEFSVKYSCSLDYLILDKSNTLTSSFASQGQNIDTFTFWGLYSELNIKPGDTISLNRQAMHSLAYYLLCKNSIYFISHVLLDPFKSLATLIDYEETISIDEFSKINLGLIESAK